MNQVLYGCVFELNVFFSFILVLFIPFLWRSVKCFVYWLYSTYKCKCVHICKEERSFIHSIVPYVYVLYSQYAIVCDYYLHIRIYIYISILTTQMSSSYISLKHFMSLIFWVCVRIYIVWLVVRLFYVSSTFAVYLVALSMNIHLMTETDSIKKYFCKRMAFHENDIFRYSFWYCIKSNLRWTKVKDHLKCSKVYLACSMMW